MLSDWERAALDRAEQMRRDGRVSYADLASEFGKSEAAIKKALERARKKLRSLDPHIRDRLLSAGVQTAEGLHSGWIKTQREDGTGESLYFQVAQEKESPETLANRVRDALADIPAVKPVAPPLHSEGDLLGLIPIADLHIGMMAWGRETGEDWNSKAACERLVKWSGQVIRSMPRCGVCVLLFNGDTLHADDQRNVTPANKHQLDVDTRHFRTIDMAVTAIAIATDLALQWHGHVILAIKRGNHDEHAYMALLFAMAQRYRLESRVTVAREPSEFWRYEFGRVLLMAHHGDRIKPEGLILNLANEFAEEWGRTRYRYLWTGHLHHLKAADIGGVQWEQSRAVTSRDAYASARAYPARAELQGVVYHYEKGEIARVRVAA